VPSSKSAPKAAKKPAAKPAASAAPAKKPVAPAAKPSGKPAAPGKPEKAPLPPLARGNGPAAAAAKGVGEEPEAPKLEKLAEGTLCQIEILKDGHFFIARTQTESGQAKEYKNTVFEDLLTEMLITLQEQLAD